MGPGRCHGRVAVAAVIATLALPACAATSTVSRPAPVAPSPSSDVTRTATATATATAGPVDRQVRARPSGAPGDYAVGSRTLRIVDRRRVTPARGGSPAHRGRVLRTSVWYPIARSANVAVPPCAPPSPARFPLVVFAHGYDVTPLTYHRLLRLIASAGYVVAAPLFPISGAGLPGPAREDDLPAQPGDLSRVISVLRPATGQAAWLASCLDRTKVAVVGHSDGAETVAAMLCVPADRDPRVSAAVVLAGQIPTWGPQSVTPRIPVLVEQGRLDTINPPVLSQQLFARLRAPKMYLDVVDGGHLPPVAGRGVTASTLRRAVVAFLGVALHYGSRQAARLHRWGDRPGVTRLLIRR